MSRNAGEQKQTRSKEGHVTTIKRSGKQTQRKNSLLNNTLIKALPERATKNNDIYKDTEASEVYVDHLGSSDWLYPNLQILKWPDQVSWLENLGC